MGDYLLHIQNELASRLSIFTRLYPNAYCAFQKRVYEHALQRDRASHSPSNNEASVNALQHVLDSLGVKPDANLPKDVKTQTTGTKANLQPIRHIETTKDGSLASDVPSSSLSLSVKPLLPWKGDQTVYNLAERYKRTLIGLDRGAEEMDGNLADDESDSEEAELNHNHQ